VSKAFTYRDLDAWKQGMEVVEEVYKVTKSFPANELYGLTSQIRRAAISIPSNIAEGHCRRSTKAFANHVSIALGSAGELETCIELAARLGFLKAPESTQLLASANLVGRLLYGLYGSLERRLESPALRPLPSDPDL
jgi:four helix bundle protein